MGKRISFDIAQELARAKQDNENSIYAPHNSYGYKINIHHPQIRPLYERYKEYLGENILSDKQRFEFEMIIFKMIEKKKSERSK
ncbi:MAG: hypothetical protein J6Y71_02655 [Ruminococcus sp.]|nr:hypothetical protein [Ruminococcus sp.]